MNSTVLEPNHRILIVDDNPAIHEDFRRILVPAQVAPALVEAEALLFGAAAAPPSRQFELHSAYQGQEALERVQQAVAAGRPFALAFVDVRMPPG